MPFTFSHAAAGYPLRRLPLAWTAFFIGSFAPDFEYFLLLAPQSAYGHRWPGMLFFSLPAALVALLLWELFVRETVVTLLPDNVQRRIPPPNPDYPKKRLLLVLFSAALGIATHILWDAFTHDQYWGARLFPLLLHPVTLPLYGTRSLAHVLQLISSVFGALLTLFWSREWLRAQSETQPLRAEHPSRLRFLSIYAFLIAVAFATVRAGRFTFPFNPRRFAILMLVDIIALLWWFLVATGILRRLFASAPRTTLTS